VTKRLNRAARSPFLAERGKATLADLARHGLVRRLEAATELQAGDAGGTGKIK
jgi:hypothetical protein